MTLNTTCPQPTAPARSTPGAPAATEDLAVLDGWQLLAAASLGRLLTNVELAAAEHLPAEIALDLLFPDLGDAARHEALASLG